MSEATGVLLAVLSLLVGWRRRCGHDESVAQCPSRSERPTSFLGRVIECSALHERALFAYVLMLLVAVLIGGGEHRQLAMVLVAADLAGLALAIITLRSAVIDNRFVNSMIARLIVIGTLVVTFFQLDIILPAARNGTVDATLFAIDMRLFGVEPAVALDRWVSSQTTEWFAFFYFSYFLLLAAHILPFMLFERRLRLVGELALGMVTVYCVGHLTYLLIPGFGPYRLLSFAHPLEGQTWWRLVQSGAGAINETSRTDIFPSLHTAGPLFLAFFSFRNRGLKPFRYTWPVVALVSTQIVIATMFLRWHYLIDVIAGVTLAAGADLLARYASKEAEDRDAAGLPPIWTPLQLRDLIAATSRDTSSRGREIFAPSRSPRPPAGRP